MPSANTNLLMFARSFAHLCFYEFPTMVLVVGVIVQHLCVWHSATVRQIFSQNSNKIFISVLLLLNTINPWIISLWHCVKKTKTNGTQGVFGVRASNTFHIVSLHCGTYDQVSPADLQLAFWRFELIVRIPHGHNKCHDATVALETLAI